jgi:hypothetical protein
MWQDSSQVLSQLEHQIRSRTGRRLRDLSIEMRPERIILRGRTTTYYVKQLAQHGVRDIFPQICLENVIDVDGTYGGPPRAA